MEKEGGYPPIGKNHDYPDFVNLKGLYSTILEQMNLTHKPTEKSGFLNDLEEDSRELH